MLGLRSPGRRFEIRGAGWAAIAKLEDIPSKRLVADDPPDGHVSFIDSGVHRFLGPPSGQEIPRRRNRVSRRSADISAPYAGRSHPVLIFRRARSSAAWVR